MLELARAARALLDAGTGIEEAAAQLGYASPAALRDLAVAFGAPCPTCTARPVGLAGRLRTWRRDTA